MGTRLPVKRLARERFDDVVDTLCAAFRDYPVMRYVIGDVGDDYDARLVHLVGYFTDSRMSRGWPVLGIDIDGELVAAANVSPPLQQPAPPVLVQRFEAMRVELGPAAIERFGRFASACDALEPDEPHYYLGMIGVRPRHQGRGLARPLIDAVHEMSRRDPASRGVALSTETPQNLDLYRHLGYRVIGQLDVDDLHTWTLFRPDDS